MSFPAVVPCRDVLMTKRTSIVDVLASQAALVLVVLIELIVVDCFFAPSASLELPMLLAFSQQVIGKWRNFDHLGTSFAGGQEWTLPPKMQVHFIWIHELLICFSAELAHFGLSIFFRLLLCLNKKIPFFFLPAFVTTVTCLGGD